MSNNTERMKTLDTDIGQLEEIIRVQKLKNEISQLEKDARIQKLNNEIKGLERVMQLKKEIAEHEAFLSHAKREMEETERACIRKTGRR
jgi:chromosome segregation ATPase